MNTTFAELKLTQIQPNPNNPRKTFDEKAVNELAESIKSKGVLQPIVVRPKGNDYFEIVCGERRFRASKIAGINRIPVTIRELSDEDALELMLMENFQRQDVHPMEEALGFEALTKISKLTVKDIAARIGKNWHYVADRLKLVKLIPELQPYYFEGKFNLTTAVNVASLSEDFQREWMEEKEGETWQDDWNEDADYFKQVTANLTNAPFDITDEKLIADRGSCIGCAFNTATSQLFPELGGDARCRNTVCFNKKSDANFRLMLQDAIDNGITIVANNWVREVRDMLKDIDYISENCVSLVEEPNREVFLDDNDVNEPFDSEDPEELEDYNDRLATAEREYQDALKQYQRNLKSSDAVKVMYVESKSKFRITKAVIDHPGFDEATSPNKKVKPKDVIAQINDGDKDPSLPQLKVAVKQLEDDIQSQREICDEKIFQQVKDLFYEKTDEDGTDHHHPALLKFSELHPIEQRAAVFVMLDDLGFVYRDSFLADFTHEDISVFEDIDDEEIVDKVLEIVDFAAFRNAWLRWMINKQIPFRSGQRSENTGTAAKLFIQFAHHHCGGEVDAIEDETISKYKKRIDTLVKQKEAIEQKLAELETKPKAKKKK